MTTCSGPGVGRHLTCVALLNRHDRKYGRNRPRRGFAAVYFWVPQPPGGDDGSTTLPGTSPSTAPRNRCGSTFYLYRRRLPWPRPSKGLGHLISDGPPTLPQYQGQVLISQSLVKTFATAYHSELSDASRQSGRDSMAAWGRFPGLAQSRHLDESHACPDHALHHTCGRTGDAHS